MSVRVVRMLNHVHENYAKICRNFGGKKNMSRISKGMTKKAKPVPKNKGL
jgi:hypothetical protein